MLEKTVVEKYSPVIGMIAGQGALPEQVIHYCRDTGKELFVVYIEDGSKEIPAYLETLPHIVLKIGEVGKAIAALKEKNIQQVTFAGKVPRVSFKSLKVDFAGARLMANITKNLSKGDNIIFCQIIKFFEEKGLEVVGAHEVAEALLAPHGIIGRQKPSKHALKDIEYGKTIAHGIGALDIGQSIIVQDGVVLGVEAVEGTDQLIERCQALQSKGKGAVLVKMKKPNQDARIDMPTIGVQTIINIAEAGFAGIAVEAGGTLVIDREAVIKEANQRKVFIVGI